MKKNRIAPNKIGKKVKNQHENSFDEKTETTVEPVIVENIVDTIIDTEKEVVVDDKQKKIVVPQQIMDNSNKLSELAKKECEANIEAIKLQQEKMAIAQKEMMALTEIVEQKEYDFLLMKNTFLSTENDLLREKAKLDGKKAEFTNLQFQMLLENKKNETIMAQVNGYNKGLTEGVIITNKYDLTRVTNLKKGSTLVFDYLQGED